jgi:acyl carrier protein
MTPCTPEAIRDSLLALYADRLNERGLSASGVPDHYDLLVEGIIDSLGILELIGHIEEQFQITVDLEGLDAEQITVIGPLCAHVARTARPRTPAEPGKDDPCAHAHDSVA